MQKVIDGKKYDTDTAQLIGSQSYSHPGDFNYVEENLYLKRTGEFFLHGCGGANSKYSVSVGSNTMSGSERIEPLDFSEARRWAEIYLSVEDYEKYFGEVAEDDSKKIMSLSVSTTGYEKLKRVASEQGVSISALIDAYANGL